MIKRSVFSTIIAIFIAAATIGSSPAEISASANGTTLNNYIALAKQQIANDEGTQYWWQVFAKLDKISDEELLGCMSKKTNPTAMYRYVLEIGADGTIERVHWETSDEFTKCIDGVLIGMKFAAPPQAPFYFYLSEI